MKFIWLSSALFIALVLIAGLCFGQSESNPQSPKSKPQPQGSESAPTDSQERTEKNPAVIQYRQTTPSDQKPPESNTPKQNAEFSEKVVMWSAAIQAAMAVIVAGFTGLLLWYSHRGWQVAKQTADIARDSLVIGERAYLTLDEFSVYLTPGERPTLKYEILNTGRTPAVFISAKHGFAISEDIPEIPVYSSVRTEAPVTIPAGNKIDISTPATPKGGFVFSNDLIPDLKSKKTYVYYWGLITYRDVFKETRHFAFGMVYDMDTCECEVYKSEKYNYSD